MNVKRWILILTSALALTACGNSTETVDNFFSAVEGVRDSACECWMEVGTPSRESCETAIGEGAFNFTETEKECLRSAYESLDSSDAEVVDDSINCISDYYDDLSTCIGAMECSDLDLGACGEGEPDCPEIPDAIDDMFDGCVDD